MPLEGVEVAVAVEQRVPLADAMGCDDAVDCLAHGDAAGAQRTEVARRGERDFLAAGGEDWELRQLPGDAGKHLFAANSLQYLAEDEVGKPNRRTTHLALEPEALQVLIAGKEIYPDSRIDDDHIHDPELRSISPRLIQIAFPFHFPPEFTHVALRLHFYEQLEGCVDGRLLGCGAAAAHGALDQLVVDLDICAHGNNPPMCKDCIFLCMRSNVDEAALLFGFFAEGGELGVEELGGEGAGEGFDGGLLGGSEGCAGGGEAGGGAFEFGLADGFGGLLQGDDDGDGVAGLQALVVELDLAGDDGFGGGGFSAAVGEVGGGDLLQVVNVVDEAAFDLVHEGIDVAGDGDVDEEHGAVAAEFEEALAVGAEEDGLRRAGGGEDDVCAGGLVVELVEWDDLGGAGEARAVDGNGAVGELHGDLIGDLAGELRGALRGAVGDEDGGCSLLDEMARGEVGHLARADDEDGLAAQAAEYLAREIDGDRCDGDGGAADAGLGADALGDREGALEEWFERGGDGPGLTRDGVGLLDLAEDLRLADDHGVERAGDAEEMADGLALAELVEVRFEGGGGDGEVLVQEAEEVGGIAVAGVVLNGEELDAVAGGEDEGFADSRLMGEGACGVGEAGQGDGEALAHLDGRGGVVDAEQDQCHGAPNPRTWLTRFAIHTTSIATRTAPER